MRKDRFGEKSQLRFRLWETHCQSARKVDPGGPSKLDPYLADIEAWLSAEPRITALAIVGRLAERLPEQFGPPQHSIVQRLLRSLRRKTASKIIASEVLQSALPAVYVPGIGGDAASHGHFASPPVPPIIREAAGAFKVHPGLSRRPSESNIAP